MPPQELFPANKRSCEHFSKYFTDAGLKELSDFARNQQSIGARKELQKELQEQMARGDPQKEVRSLTTGKPRAGKCGERWREVQKGADVETRDKY